MVLDAQRRLTPEQVTAGSRAEGMVGVPLWPRVEGGHLLPDGRAAQRLSRLRGQSPKPAGPSPSRLGGQSVKQRYRPHLNL